MQESNTVYQRIADLRKSLKTEANANENGRIKSMINTQLQLAELLAKELYNKEA